MNKKEDKKKNVHLIKFQKKLFILLNMKKTIKVKKKGP